MQFKTPKFKVTRRKAICYAGASLAGAIVPQVGIGAPLEPMQNTVARQARDLAGGRQVTLQFLLPEGSTGNVNPVISAFTEMTGIAINIVETPVEDINAELLLESISEGQRFDIALPATFGLPDLVAANAIRPMSDFAQRYEPDGFRDGILYGIGDGFDDEIYGFQTDGDAYLMTYNKAMLESRDEQARYADIYGYPLAKPTTWKELDQQMAFFQRPEQGMWGGALFRSPGYLEWEWWIRFHAKGVWPFSAEMVPQIASHEGVNALEELMSATKNLVPEADTLRLFGNWERYAQGDVYCNIGWGGSQKYLNGPKSKMRGKMVYGPTPGGMVQDRLLATPYFNWGWNYVLPSNSQQAELSYLFALFASTPEMSTLAVRQPDGFFDPFRPEHYQDAGIKAAYTSEFLAVHRQSLETAMPDLYLQGQSEYFRTLGQWLSRVQTGEVAPKLALERVAQRWDLITTSLGRADQQKRWRRLRAKYPLQLRQNLRDYS